MSTTQIAFDILAHDKASHQLERVGHAAEEQHSRLAALSGAFGKFGSMVGGEVGELADKVSEGFDQMGEHQGKLGQKLMALGGVVTGLGVFMQHMGSKDKAAMQQLDAAVQQTGKGFAAFHEEMERAVHRAEKFGHTAPDTVTALRELTQATNDPKTALEEMGIVEDLAAAKHESLAEAGTQLARVHGGAGKILKEFGITMAHTANTSKLLATAEKQHQTAVDNLAKAQSKLHDLELIDSAHKKLSISQQLALQHAHEAVTKAQGKLADSTAALTKAQDAAKHGADAHQQAIDELAHKLSGQASAASNTFAGHMDALKAKLEDTASNLGNKFGGAITAAGPVIFGFGAIMETGMIGKLGSATKAMAMFSKSMLIGLAEAGQALLGMAADALVWGAEMLAAGIEAALPFLPLIAAVALVGVAAYELYKHWDQVWGFIKTAAEAAWHFLRDDVFHPVVVGFQVVGDGIVKAWHAVEHFFSGMWDGIKDAWNTVTHWFSQAWSNEVTFWTSLPGKLGHVFDGMWDGIKVAFKAVINAVIDLWNGFVGMLHIKPINIGPIHFPGWDPGSSMQIPHLAAGGIVTGPTIAMIGEGGEPEAVVPRSRAAEFGFGGGGGMTVNVTVEGSVMQERDLARSIREELAQLIRRRGGDPGVLGLA